MKTHILSGALLALAFFIPVFVHGAVVINEIAWMGTAVSATDEWIELYNDGAEEVSLVGWKLIADDGAPSILLSGTIPANSYYLLERTDDMSVPDIAADKIYTGDLGNTGEILKLLNESGATVDTVTGGADWQNIGGYNETKDTPQRQVDGTWLTGTPTPKALNTTTAIAPPSDGEVAGTSTSKTTSTRKRTITGGYKQVVFGYAGENMNGVVGITIPFEGFAVSDKNILLPTAKYRWSFGDGARKQGRYATHAYEEPGTYVIVLHVFDEHQKWQDTITATILPTAVTISRIESGDRGYIEVRNENDAELDLSNWKLSVSSTGGRSREATFTIPETTLIAPRTSVRFSAHVTELVVAEHDIVALRYPSGIRASKSMRDHVAATSSVAMP
jgi:hypothetical protein